MSNPQLSIVSTLFNSASYIEEFYQRISNASRQIVGESFEVILVNDGSPDKSLEVAVNLSKRHGNIIIVDLSRNFGHHKAMMTGLSYAQGQQVFLIDVDLEEEPEYLISFAEKMDSDKCDTVYGVQEKRKGGIFERKSGEWFYRIFNFLSGLELPENIVTARLMTRRYVQALVAHQEREIMIAGLWHITGFDQQPIVIQKHSSSATSYNIRRKLSVFVNSITSFSNAPLKGIFYIGIVISLIAGLYTLYLVFNKIFLVNPLPGWTSVMASVWILGGLIISFMGVIGIYLAKIFSETKQRPYTIIRQIYGRE